MSPPLGYHRAMARALSGKRGRPRKRLPPRMRRGPSDDTAASLVTAVLQAAEQLLAEHGPPGLATNRVAKRAGVSIGSLYEYFPNKEAIVAALFERYTARFLEVLAQAIATPGTYGELIERIVVRMIELYCSQPPIHRHLFELQGAADMHARSREVTDVGEATIARVLETGGLPTERARSIAFVLTHAMNGVCIAVFERSIRDPMPYARPLLDLVRHYFRSIGLDDKPVGS